MLLLLALLWGCTSSRSQDPIRIGYDPTWYGIDVEGQATYLNGYMQELLLEMSRNLKVPFALIQTHSSDLLSDLNQGKCNAILSDLMAYEFNLAKYQKLAYGAIDDILKRGKLPILVGGSGLYLQAVIDGYVLSEAKPDKKFRDKLEKMDVDKLFSYLQKIDKKAASEMNESDRNNPRRLIRKIEMIKGGEGGEMMKGSSLSPKLLRRQDTNSGTISCSRPMSHRPNFMKTADTSCHSRARNSRPKKWPHGTLSI